jgi:hypothetical protein
MTVIYDDTAQHESKSCLGDHVTTMHGIMGGTAVQLQQQTLETQASLLSLTTSSFNTSLGEILGGLQVVVGRFSSQNVCARQVMEQAMNALVDLLYC